MQEETVNIFFRNSNSAIPVKRQINLLVWLIKNLKVLSIIILTAPSMILKMSQRYPQMTMLDVGVPRGTEEMLNNGHKKIARKPDSNS